MPLRNLIKNKKLTSIALALCISLSSLSIACDPKKIARESLKASQDVQLFINNFASTLLEAEKKGFISHERAAEFKKPLEEFINYNEFLNEQAISLSRASHKPRASERDALLQALSNMLINLATVEGMTLLHVTNPQSQQAIRLLLVGVRGTIQTLQVVILKG